MKLEFGVVAGLLVVGVGVLVDASAARAEETEVSFAYVPAPNAESVTIDQPLGRLSITAWDKPEVRIVAHKYAPGSDELDRLRVNVEMASGQIHIRTGVRIGGAFQSLPVDGAGGAGIDLSVDAPRQAMVQATTWSGDLDASGFRAGAELSSSGGEVTARDITGRVHTSALKGRQRLSAIRGDVIASGVVGDLEVDTIDGDVLEAKVVEGQIIARAVRSSVVRLFSSSGKVIFIGAVRPGGRYELATREGDVKLVLTRVPFSVVARARGGRVTSGFRLRGATSPTQVNGDFMGGGAALELTAWKGNVSLEPSP